MTDDPRIDPADLRNVRFPGSSRRYDARSVDQFLETVASRIAATNVLVDELRQQLESAEPAPAAPAPPAPELSLLDDDELVRLVGEETATVLSTARRAAEEIRSKAEESAARVIREATAEADRLGEEARTRSAELTSQAEEALARATAEASEEAERIRREATEAAERVTAESQAAAEEQQAALDARRAEADAEVEEILEAARAEGRAMVAEAKEVRHRILEDLQRRRDIARDHIERLLAGRERLLGAYELVRENLDDITGQLADALPDPGEPELPDGFVGIVGSEPAVDDGDEAEGPAGADEPAATEDEVDDTVAPADVATDDAPADGPDDTVASPDDEAEPAAEADAADDDADDEADGEGEVDHEVDVDAEGEPDDVAAIAAEEDEPVEVEVHDDEPPADPDEPVETAEAADEPAGDVDALFARLRAEREESVARAQAVLTADGAAAEAEEATPDDPAPVEDAAEPADGAAEADAPATGDVDRVPAEFLAPDDELARRTEALAPLTDNLNRALKRRLADEQNELLDLLRRSGATEPDGLLPQLDAQVDGYAGTAVAHLAKAATAGTGGSGEVHVADLADLADALGRTIVEPFRRRVERAAADVDGDPDELDERLRALYREWKVQHIGPAADDALLSAYALGTLRGAGDGAKVRWCIDPAQGPCPDAQDNALEGAIAAGEPFPTGDACPQAHPGCRCLLVVE